MSYENFDPKDLLIQAYSTKPEGGLGPHRIPRGIMAIHLPTGTAVTCDADRSQHKNRHDALTQLWEQVQGKPTYQELLAERDALAAQNAYLTGLVKSEAHDAYWEASDSNRADRLAANFDDSVRQQFERYWATNNIESRLLQNTQHHLRERDAQKGRAGFVAGAVAVERSQFFAEGFDLYSAANQYADSVRKGEVK